MKTLKITVLFVISMLLAMPTQAQKEVKPVYQITDNVEVPHTIVQNQAQSGTCWCFAGTGFVEAEILRVCCHFRRKSRTSPKVRP